MKTPAGTACGWLTAPLLTLAVGPPLLQTPPADQELQLRSWVVEALAALPEKQRQALALRYGLYSGQELSHADVAQQMQVCFCVLWVVGQVRASFIAARVLMIPAAPPFFC